jgi:MFS transporter, DHA1 family, multidrug resistance protein
LFRNSRLAILFFTMVVIMLGFGIIIPIMPFYITSFGAGGSDLGLLMAIFSLMQFIFSPIWGNLSDRYGRKKILMLGALGNALSMLMFGLAPNLAWMFVSRALAGMLSSATLPTAMAYISDSTTDRDRGQGMGIIGAAMGVGMVLGPGLGGWMGKINLSAPFYLAAGLSLVAMLLMQLFLPETLSVEAQAEARAATDGKRIRGPQLGMLYKSLFGPIGFLLFLAFLVNFGLANFEGIFGLYAKERYNYGPAEVGTIMTVIGVISALIQGVLTGPITRWLGEERVINLSLVASALGFGLMLAARSYAAVLVTVGFFVFSNAMLRPAIASLTSKRVRGGQGMVMGLNNSYQSLGRVVGPLWAGFLFDVNLRLPYASAAVIMLFTFVLGLFWLHRVPPLTGETAVVEPSGD